MNLNCPECGTDGVLNPVARVAVCACGHTWMPPGVASAGGPSRPDGSRCAGPRTDVAAEESK